MTQDRFVEPSFARVDIGRVVKDGHRRILELHNLYLGSPADSRQDIVQRILHQLASHLELEEGLLFQEIQKSGSQGREFIGAAELEHAEVKAMIYTLQQSEADDDQEWDEFFEDMMQSVRTLFVNEERDLLPLVDPSLDA